MNTTTTAATKAELDRLIFNNIEASYNATIGITDSEETWLSATNNAADTCKENKQPIWDGNQYSDDFIAWTFLTLEMLLDDGYPGRAVFASFGFGN